jgi:hypothetical protein
VPSMIRGSYPWTRKTSGGTVAKESFRLTAPFVDGLGARMLAAARTNGMDAHNFGFFAFPADFAQPGAGILDP